ncbi:MAG: hypothetical protein WCC57_02755 [Paracoccaceae bacterium]
MTDQAKSPQAVTPSSSPQATAPLQTAPPQSAVPLAAVPLRAVPPQAVPPVRIAPVQAVPASVKPVPFPGAVPVVKPDPFSVGAKPQHKAKSGFLGLKRRHRIVVASFALCVVLPVVAAASYMAFIAADQYHSRAAFSIRSEGASVGMGGLLGALTQVSSGSATDADILYDYIRSQEIVEDIEADINLSKIYSRATNDPVFTLGSDPTIEDLSDQWESMVQVSRDSATGILQIQTEAFTPEDAQLVAKAILDKSSILVNKLADAAQSDAIRFGKVALDEAEANLFKIRSGLTDFRRKNGILDPRIDAEGQIGVLNALQSELARALVERDSLLAYAKADDPRVTQLDTRIQSITTRINAERRDLSGSSNDTTVDIFGEYEDFLVQQEFAQMAYTGAMASLAAAREEARRQARYITVHVEPTLAQSSLYPRSWLLVSLAALYCMIGWAVLMLVYYNVRDNR